MGIAIIATLATKGVWFGALLPSLHVNDIIFVLQIAASIIACCNLPAQAAKGTALQSHALNERAER